MVQRPKGTPISQSMFARVKAGLGLMVNGTTDESWFGAGEPMEPIVPENQEESVKGRKFDFDPFYNTVTTGTKKEGGVTFQQLRLLADSLPILRGVIETRKDQISRVKWGIRPRNTDEKPCKTCEEIEAFLQYPDRDNDWDDWLRSIMEDMLVVDAATVEMRMTKGGKMYSLDQVDGTTIKPLITDLGRKPLPPEPSYQQILQGSPVADFTSEELIYKPRNKRVNKVYGYSQVEQVVATVDLALRRQISQNAVYTDGSIPDVFIQCPAEWSDEDIKSMQLWFDSKMKGVDAEKRGVQFMPGGGSIEPMKEPVIITPEVEEWIARIICYIFSVPYTPFVGSVNRATAETVNDAALSEGLEPLLKWVKSLMDRVITIGFKRPDIEFFWEEAEEKASPKERAEIHEIYLKSKVYTVNEVREKLGEEPVEGGDEFSEDNTPEDPNDKTDKEDKKEEKEPDKNKEPAEKVEKAKKKSLKTLEQINRERPEIVKVQSLMETLFTKYFNNNKQSYISKVVKGYKSLSKAEIDDKIEAMLAQIELGNIGDLTKSLETLTIVAYESGGKAAIKQLTNYMTTSQKDDMFSVLNEQAVSYARAQSADMIGMKWVDGKLVQNPNAIWRINETTRDMVRVDVREALENGWSNQKLAKKLRENFAFSKERAIMIARTETGNADEEVILRQYEESGVVKKKKWLTYDGTNDVDGSCAVNGEIVDIDKPFSNGRMRPKSHPNCRCTTTPVIEEE